MTIDITTLLGRHGVTTYSLWKVRGPLGSGIAWMEAFAVGINGKDRLIVETAEDGTETIFEPSPHKRPQATAASIAMRLNAEPPPANTYPRRPGEHEPHIRENAGGVDVWSDASGQGVYRK